MTLFALSLLFFMMIFLFPTNNVLLFITIIARATNLQRMK